MFLVANRGWEGTKAGLWEGDFAGVGDIKRPAHEDMGQHSRLRESECKGPGAGWFGMFRKTGWEVRLGWWQGPCGLSDRGWQDLPSSKFCLCSRGSPCPSWACSPISWCLGCGTGWGQSPGGWLSAQPDWLSWEWACSSLPGMDSMVPPKDLPKAWPLVPVSETLRRKKVFADVAKVRL